MLHLPEQTQESDLHANTVHCAVVAAPVTEALLHATHRDDATPPGWNWNFTRNKTKSQEPPHGLERKIVFGTVRILNQRHHHIAKRPRDKRDVLRKQGPKQGPTVVSPTRRT